MYGDFYGYDSLVKDETAGSDFIVMGLMIASSVLSFVCSFFMPETKGKVLDDEIEEIAIA